MCEEGCFSLSKTMRVENDTESDFVIFGDRVISKKRKLSCIKSEYQSDFSPFTPKSTLSNYIFLVPCASYVL